MSVSALNDIKQQSVGVQQLADAENRVKPTSTGMSGLDKLLGGGLFPGDVVELYGKSGSGKTLLSLYLTSRVCHFSDDHSQNVLYFDMKNDFNALRLHGLCEKSDESLSRVRVFKAASYESLFSQLEEIQYCASSDTHEVYCRSKLIVIDSVPMAIYPAVKQESYSWRLHQEKLLEKLEWLAKHLALTVILVNHAVTTRPNPDDGRQTASSTLPLPTVKPAMGAFWSQKINTRIHLANSGNHFAAVLEKSVRACEAQEFKFSVAANGNLVAME